jgi:hypothetical protein
VSGTVLPSAFAPRTAVTDASNGGEIGFVDDLQRLPIWLGGYAGG